MDIHSKSNNKLMQYVYATDGICISNSPFDSCNENEVPSSSSCKLSKYSVSISKI